MAVRTRMTENPSSNQRDPSPQSAVPVPVPVESVILGVDTHKDIHAAAVVTPVGVLLDARSFPASAHGYQQLLLWARGFGTLRRAGVEGTSSSGAALSRHLRAHDVNVLEVNQPDKAHRRRRGKTDLLDAEAAAVAVLSGRATAVAKAGTGAVEMTRMFKLAKASAVKSRTQAINQLKAVVVTADPALRESLAGLSTLRLVRRCAELTGDPKTVPGATSHTLRLLARRITHLTEEIDDLDERLAETLDAHAPALLDRRGVGPDTAAALLIAAGDNPERLGSQASFAALCGVSPVESSSGKQSRLRLNRGGDRQANAALHRIALSRLRWDSRTQHYVQRRVSEGKTRREALRCLKRYIARELYPLLRTTPKPEPVAPNAEDRAA
ncbi:MAG: IS110 family transposase [Actinomycetota bacterium]|nr:IS110 family transposase [Actinomycetota bacterium]